VSDDEAESWHWADADGVISIVDDWELVSSLSTGSLPHYTLVWRIGWKQWLPACKVAELSTSLPKSKLEQPVDPGSDPLLTEPPPPPVDRYQAYKTREAAAMLLGSSAKPAARVPVAPPTGRPPSLVPTPPPPPIAARPAQPTLVEVNPIQATATLRPPGAVPPPPPAVPLPTPFTAPVAPLIREKIVEEPAPISVEAPTNPHASPAAVASPESAPLPSWSEDLDAEVRANMRPARGKMQPSAYAPPPPLANATPAVRSSSGWVIGLVAIGGVGLIGASVVAWLALRPGKAPAPSLSASGSAGGATDKTPVRACRLDRAAARLSTAINPAVAPVVAATPAGGKFAIGFAASDREAEGITVDASTLAVERPFRESTRRDVTSVVPLTAGGNLSFAVDQDEPEFRSARTIDVRGPWTLGWTAEGLARRAGSGAPTTLWTTPSDKATDPKVAALPSGGFAVTARRGGQSGTVLVGLLGASGEQQGPVVDVSAKPQVGSPAIAASDRGVLVAFAGRPTDESYWTLQVGTAPAGALPTKADGFATPPGGLGADAISPAVEGVSNGRWLLQWTEGAPGQRQVRIQTLGFDLVPVGDPINLSPEALNAGQGVVVVQGDQAISLFLVKKGKAHELWGATLSCP
jgi:hypothetical protein